MAAKQLSKSEILNSISGTTELSRKQVASVIDALGDLAKKNVGKKGPGIFVLSGIAEDRGDPQARSASSQGDQSLHQAGADVQGQARSQGHQDPGIEGVEGCGEVND